MQAMMLQSAKDHRIHWPPQLLSTLQMYCGQALELVFSVMQQQ